MATTLAFTLFSLASRRRCVPHFLHQVLVFLRNDIVKYMTLNTLVVGDCGANKTHRAQPTLRKRGDRTNQIQNNVGQRATYYEKETVT